MMCFLLSPPVEAVVEFDYEAQQDDELSLTVGDIIVNIRRDDGGWWEGELGGRRGLFPDNFVRVSNGSQPNTSSYTLANFVNYQSSLQVLAELGGKNFART